MGTQMETPAISHAKAAIIFGLFVLLTPAQTDASACWQDGYTIVFINGVLNSQFKAETSKSLLDDKLTKSLTFSEGVKVKLAYNETHLAGGGDVSESIFQAFNGSISDFDLQTILMQLHDQVQTQKILLVGHSQGTFYTNAVYRYLVAHGVPEESVAVYNIATPASQVAGGGLYITSSNDKLINWVRGKEVNGDVAIRVISRDTIGSVVSSALRTNITIPQEPGWEDNKYGGHGFDIYIQGAGDRIVSDISKSLARLKASQSAPVADGCFDPPQTDMKYKMQAAAFAVGDPVFGAVAQALKGAFADIASAAQFIGSTRGAGLALLSGGVEQNPPNLSQAAATSLVVEQSPSVQTTKTVSLSSNNANTKTPTVPPPQSAELPTQPLQTKRDSSVPSPLPTGTSPGFGGGGSASNAPVAAATEVPPDTTPPASTTMVVSDCALSIIPGICAIPSRTAHLVWDTAADATSYAVSVNGILGATTTLAHATATLAPDATNTIAVFAYDDAGNSAVSDSVDVRSISQPIRINEIGWAGDGANPTNQWIELRNLSGFDIDLSHMRIARSGGDAIELSGTFGGSTPYLVVEPNDIPFTGSFKFITPFASLATTGEQLSLVWNSEVIDTTPAVAECSGWCAGSTHATLGSNVSGSSDLRTSLSMERVEAAADGSIASSWQSTDSYGPWLGTGGAVWGTPGSTNSFGLSDAGVYCGSPGHRVEPNTSYHPDSGSCVYLAKFITAGFPAPTRVGAIYKGRVENSVGVGGADFGRAMAGFSTVDFSGAQSGDEYFFAIWEQRIGDAFSSDSQIFQFYFTQGASSTQGISGPPHGNYVTIPFTYQP